jgi:hypothetical protein
MSRGLGTVQRNIAEVLAANPDDAFTVEELCQQVYTVFAEKKHRVSILRAAKALAEKNRSFGWTGSSAFGYVFFNVASVMSYGRARIKAGGHRYIGDIDGRLAPGERYHKYIAEGGEWWLLVQKWTAEQNKDTARLRELKPMLDAMEEARGQEMAALIRMFG